MILNDETRRKLRLMNIGEFVDAIELQQQEPQTVSMPFDERFQLLVDTVYQQKYNEKVHRLLKTAKLRIPQADVHNILYSENRPLNRSVMDELASCRFVDNCQSVVFQGFTSSGKTYLGCALAKEACRHLCRTRYIRIPELLSEAADRSAIPGGRAKVLNKYAAYKVLVLDEWLIQDLTKSDIEFLFELSERRFDTSSTIFCTLYKREDWVKRLGGKAYAESIVERYNYNVTWIETGDTNMRQFYSRP